MLCIEEYENFLTIDHEQSLMSVHIDMEQVNV
jgi:hypothetical protein